MTSNGSPRHDGSTWMTGLGPIVTNSSDLGSVIFPSTVSILAFIHMANTDEADSKPYESVRVSCREIIPTDE
jgi:hypothetical protein